jgi:hypothetical protein
MRTVFLVVPNSDPDWIQIKGGQKVPKIRKNLEIHDWLLEGWMLCWSPIVFFPCNFFQIFFIKNLVLDLDLDLIGYSKAWILIRINKSLVPDPDLVNLGRNQRLFR